MPLPLEEICVLDLTRLIPGPFCTLILADLGAEVIKIEAPGIGDYERQIRPFQGEMAYRFMLLNRNKKSVGLNLKEDRGRGIFLDLARQADVVIEGFRPGVMDRLGLGYEDLRSVNEGLVYCSLTSYGHSGPYRDKVAHVVFSPVNTVAEALEDKQLISREMVVETEHPFAGVIRQIGSPVKLSENPVDLERLPAPRLGEHNLEVLSRIGLDDKEIRALADRGVLSEYECK